MFKTKIPENLTPDGQIWVTKDGGRWKTRESLFAGMDIREKDTVWFVCQNMLTEAMEAKDFFKKYKHATLEEEDNGSTQA